ncbi:MAG TPA: hypothetical protein VMP08_19920 [Anaerolineae bacterium]|nr:hypothetical protein [Anaerolineae bacterium]
MPHFNEASRPMIEITISRTTLRRGLVLVPLGLLLLLGVIGAAVSPLANGHPVILTREGLNLKHYLDEAQGWIQRLDELVMRLDTLSPTSIAVTTEVLTSTSTLSATLIPTGSLPGKVTLPSQAPLSAFPTPASQPANLFDRVHAAEQVIQELGALERDLQRIEPPVALAGLQELSTATLQAFATWSTQVMDTIATPASDAITAAQASRQSALVALETLRQTLTQQQGTHP